MPFVSKALCFLFFATPALLLLLCTAIMFNVSSTNNQNNGFIAAAKLRNAIISSLFNEPF